MKLVKEFCSEDAGPAGDGARNFLLLNAKPRIMFEDVCARDRTGYCSYRREQVAAPSVHLYTVGWVCRDLAQINRTRKRPLCEEISFDSGQSARTLHASLGYVRLHRPAVVILENVLRQGSIARCAAPCAKFDFSGWLQSICGGEPAVAMC